MAALLTFVATPLLAAGPMVDIVVGESAPPLERFAAQELGGQLKQLFDAKVRIGARIPAAGDAVILVGSPATNAAVKTAIGSSWPKLSDQGHVVRSVAHEGRNTLVVGGGSPVATLWAVYELGHHFGIRYLLRGDVLPAAPPAFKLDGFNITLEPNLRTRAFRTLGESPIGTESYSLAEQRKLIGQLAKLKFNRLVLMFSPWQPFVDFEFQGIKKTTAVLALGQRFPVEGDTPGRAAFGGKSEFGNPDLMDKTTPEDRTRAGIALARGILQAAREHGLTAAIAVSPLEFPKEFAPLLPSAKPTAASGGLAIVPGKQQRPDDRTVKALAVAQLRAHVQTYPTADALDLLLPAFPTGWTEHAAEAWQRLDERHGLGPTMTLQRAVESVQKRSSALGDERAVQALYDNIAGLDFCDGLLADKELFQRPAGGDLKVMRARIDPALSPVLDKLVPAGAEVTHFLNYTARRIAANSQLIAQVPRAQAGQSNIILPLGDGNVGVLSQESTPSLQAVLDSLRTSGWDGFTTRYGVLSDLEPCVYFLSRASFDKSISPKAAFDSLIAPICGSDVAVCLVKSYESVAKAASLLDDGDFGLTRPGPQMLLKHLKNAGPAPAAWKEANKHYSSAMDEVYRGWQRSHVNGRPYLLYLAKRLEFVVEYLGCLESLNLAAQAQAQGDKEKAGENLEKAVEGIYNGLNALGEHARDSADRALIAVLSEYGFRPLKKKLDERDKAK